MTVKERWIEALRSGDYVQGQERLRTGDCYCCLGVLCDVIDPTLWKPDETFITHYLYDGFSKILPDKIKDELGVSIGQMAELVRMNDSEKCTFDQIADFIETWD